MKTLTVSPEFHVVIPNEVRESLGIESGQKILMLTYHNRIELIPIKSMKNMKGFLNDIDTELPADNTQV